MSSAVGTGAFGNKVSRRRWRPRFGLKTLLITTAVIAAGFGYIGYLLRRVQHQRHVVEKVQEAAGAVRYNWQIGMGPYLDPTTHGDFTTHELKEFPNGLHQVTRSSSKGTVVEKEKLPGPRVLRMLLGNDTFAFVESVDFDNSSKAPGEFDPRLLLQLPHLKIVSLVDSQVSDEWLEVVAQIPELRILNLTFRHKGATATHRGLAKLGSSRKLEVLRLYGDWLTDEALTGVAKLPQLKQLDMGSSANLTASAFESIGELTELRELTVLHAKRVEDDGTAPLSKLRNLRVLKFNDTSLSDGTLAHLAGLKELEILYLISTNVGDRGAEYLASLAKLKMLDLSNTRIGDAGLDTISKLPSVRMLRLGSTNVTDASLPAIARMTLLERLDLFPCNLTDEGILHLQTLTNLKDLRVGPHITVEAADELRRLLPNCEISRFDASGVASIPDN